ncbi:MAG: PhzF family phenazine biosynthesis isomerase [Candidatus Latescibacteria bacterium]|nr:PhzF family phenazine biosynthesis isomerase [Candidatus Latescibacterota bacterium]
MKIHISAVDAFTDAPFAGNPAAVCLLPQERDSAWMQAVAQEMNLSETAFLQVRDQGFDLRWFTPAVEVDLCGHATLASAHILWETGRVDVAEAISFHTRSGILSASRQGDWIELDFPSQKPEAVALPDGLAQALGATPLSVGYNGSDYLVELADEAQVRGLQPDFARLQDLTERGLIATSRSSGGQWDFVSRFFAPAAGIDEDPVTGSAHCCLGPFWGPRLGKEDMMAYQASPRGGTVRVRLAGDRVLLGGQAITIWRGELA